MSPTKDSRQRNPSPGTFASLALVSFMLVVGAVGWRMTLGPPLHVDASSLDAVPDQIGRWHARAIPMDTAVESELRADFNLQRAYIARLEEPIWLYVGYYGTGRGGRPEHTPRGCYTGAGWGIESSRSLEFDEGRSLRATEYLLEQNGERRLVQFWYRSHRRSGMLGGLDQNIDRMLGRLLDGRADGALIRISTPITRNDTTAARGRLLAFASRVDPLIGEHWPVEFSCDETDPTACAAPSRPEP